MMPATLQPPVPMRLSCLLLLGCSSALAAEELPRPLDISDLGAPSFSLYGPRDGLPDEVSSRLAVDAEGYAWAITASTLVRFDGHRWRPQPVPGVRSVARELLRDRSGTLWAAFDADGVARREGAHWVLEDPAATGLGSAHVFDLAELDDGLGGSRLWAVTADSGLFRRRGARWEADPGNPELPAGPLIALVRTERMYGSVRQWLGTFASGLWMRNGGRWHRFEAPGFDIGQITDLLVTVDDGVESVWVVSYGRGLWRIREDGVRAWTAESGELPSNLLYQISSSEAEPGQMRELWLASRGGLTRIRGDSARSFDRSHGLPNDAVRGVLSWRSPDGERILWVATEAGIARAVTSASPWRTVTLDGARGNGVFSVMLEPDGEGGERLWVGSSFDGLGLFEHGAWRHWNARSGDLPNDDVQSVRRTLDEHGRASLYVGVGGGDLLQVEEPGLRMRRLDTPWPKRSGQSVMDLLGRVGEDGHELWAATRHSGIWLRRDGRWQAQSAAGAVAPWMAVRFVAQVDASGRDWLWASTKQGLARYDGQGWTLLGHGEGLPDLELIDMALQPTADGRAVLWIGSAHHGTIRVDVSEPLAPRVLPAAELPVPPDPTVYSALRDSRGRVYVCTNNGVQLLTPRGGGGWDAHVYRRRDGLVHDECNTNAQLIDRHDRYWVGMLGGLSVHDVSARPAPSAAGPKALRLVEVRVDGQVEESRPLRLPPTAREWRVDFALQTWQREDETRYRATLEGYDTQAPAWSAQAHRIFGTLAPGRYRLRVEAQDHTGLASEPLTLIVDVLPAWWDRPGVRVALMLGGLLLAAGLVQWRLTALRRQKRRLQQEVQARTAELHVANQRLTELSYRDALTGLANRRRLVQALHEAHADAIRRHRPLAAILVDVDHFKAYNDQHGHLAGDEALVALANAMSASAGEGALLARWGGEEFAALLVDADIEQAAALAERMRAAVEMRGAALGGITLSAGVAALLPQPGDHPESLLRAADAALYRAKHKGRNRVLRA